MIEEQTSKTNTPDLGRELMHLTFEQVAPSETNPRLSVEREPFEELKKSIHANGLLQPIVVRPRGDIYEIIGGHRRFQAIKELAHEHPKDKRYCRVPVVVVEVDDATVPVLQLAENLNRSDLNPVEIADGVARAIASGFEGDAARRFARLDEAQPEPLPPTRGRAVVVPRARERGEGAEEEGRRDRRHRRRPEDEEARGRDERYPGLQFSDLSELIALYNLLREADALQLEEQGGESFKPQAEKTTKRLAMLCAAEGWSKSKLREQIRRAKDPKPKSGDATVGMQPTIVVTPEKCVIDLRHAAAISAPARTELAAQLTRALAVFGFKSLTITP